jgi:putative ABC transport system permease protein
VRSATMLAWRSLTGHPLRSVLTALAIALGVAMVLAASTVGQAASQSADTLADTGPCIALEVVSRPGGPFEHAVLDRVRTVPGVERAAASLRVEAEGVQYSIARLELLGVDPQIYPALHDLVLANGAFLDRSDSIVLPMAVALEHGLYVGDELELRALGTGRTATLTVAGRLKAEEGVEALSGQTQWALVPLAVAQVLSGMPGQVDLVEVALLPNADLERARENLAGAVGPDLAVVRAVSTGGGSAMGNVLFVQVGLAVVGVIILFAAGFVILNAFAMSVTGRTREIGALRALGMSRRQVLIVVLVEAGLLGLVGTFVGIGTGLALAWGVMYGVGTLSTQDMPFLVPGWGLFLSATMGLGVTLVSALQPARRASRISPIAAARAVTSASGGWYVRPGGAGRVGALVLGLLLPVLVAYGLLARPNIDWALPVMMLGQGALLVATVLLLPALIDPVVKLCRPFLVRWLGTAGRLAVDNLGRNRLRTVLTAGALTAGLTIIVAVSSLLTAGLKGAVGRLRSGAQEDGFVTADLAALVESEQLTFGNFFEFITSDDLGFDLNPVVAALTPLVQDGLIRVERYRFQVVPPELSAVPGAPGLFVDPEVYLEIGSFDLFEGDPATALAWMRRGRAMLTTPIVAERLGVQVGDEVPVQTSEGQVSFRVAGIGGGSFLMTVLPYADGEAYFSVSKPSFLGIIVADEHAARKEAVLARVREAIQPFPEVTLLDYDQSLDPVLHTVDRLAVLLDGLVLLAVVVAALGVVNTTVINVSERQREIALLRAVGAAQRQVRQTVVAEAATLGLLAAFIAGGLGLLMLLTWGIIVLPGGTASVGVRADWETIRLTMGAGLRDWAVATIVSLLFGPLVAGMAAYYPARRAAAIDVAEAARSERLVLRRAGRKRPYAAPRGPLLFQLNWTITWRSLTTQRARTVLSALAIALGVMMVVAADVTGRAVTRFGNQVEESQSTAGILGAQLEMWLGAVGLVILAVAAFLVFNAFAMSVTQRRRQIGVLRSLGMTRRQVMRTVLTEALLTGLAGTILGLIAGPLVGRGLVVLLGEFAGIAYDRSPPSPGNMLLAATLGVGITLLSMVLPARRATRISPLAAMRERARPVRSEPRLFRKTGVLGALGALGAAALIVYLAAAPPALHIPPAKGGQIGWHSVLTGVLVVLWLGALALILPALIAGLGRWVRAPLSRLWGATGRLIADNLGRESGRVTLTVLTLAVSVMMIVSITGALGLLSQSMLSYYTSKQIPPRWGLFAGDESMLPSGDLVSWQFVSELDLSAFGASDELYAEIEDAFGARADMLEVRAAIVPVIDVVPGSMSFILDPDRMQRMALFDFYEGDWDTARSIMREGCGLLITPGLARRHGVWLYDTLDVPGRDGPVECTVAGLGLSANFGASLIGDTVADQFAVPERPFGLFIQPHPEADVARFGADIDTFVERHHNVYHLDLHDADDFMETMVGSMLAMLNGPLLLAIAAAALGVVNTTAMSVAERRHELGLLRAVGATRRQARAVVMGEAALMGIVGGGLGLLAGSGLAAIIVLAGDHSTWGLRDVAIWDLLYKVMRASVLNGLAGTVAAPLICAGAAWLPARATLRGTAIETMDTQRVEANPRGLDRPLALRGLQFLAWRNVSQHRTRTVLSALAVTLGVATTVAADVTSRAILNTIAGSEDAQIMMTGLLDQLDMMLTLVGVGITMAAGFLVLNAFAMSVTQRRRLIGVLRSLGMTRRQVMRTVLYEAAITGGLGTVAGLVVGPLLGRGTIALIEMFVGEGTFAFQAGGSVSSYLLLAGCLGLGMTLLSVLIPARRATRISPLTALRQEVPAAVGARSLASSPAGSLASSPAGRTMPLQWAGAALSVALFAYLAVAPPGEWITSPWDALLSAALSGLWLICVGCITPGLIGGLGQWAQRPLSRLWGATGRLVADNLRRSRGRVLLTVLTLAVALALIVGTTGFVSFMFELLLPTIEGSLQLGAWVVSELDFISGMSAYAGIENLAMPREVIGEIEDTLGEDAQVVQWHFAVVPELSFFGSTYFSFVMDPLDVRGAGNAFFTFIEGDWEPAMPAMQGGCGVLVSPSIADRNGVSLGDTLAVTGVDGPVDCTVAGIGTPYVGATIIGMDARDAFEVTDPLAVLVWPAPGTDRDTLKVELTELVDRLSLHMRPLEDLAEMQTRVSNMLPDLFSALLLLAILAAALGVVNTTVMSVAERRQELGLLRAVGATRRQVGAVVAGEAALMGLVGGAVGLVAGIGVVLVVGVTYGGNAWGMPDLDLWPAAWRASGSALVNGLFGLVAAPLICTIAAWLPARATAWSAVRGSAIETVEPERQAQTAPRVGAKIVPGRGALRLGLPSLGSIRTRFVLGTALLLLVILTGLIGVVMRHERTYLGDQMGDMLLTMIEGQAGMLEMALPPDAQTVELASLQAGQFGADQLLRFRALMEDVSEHGLEEYLVADRDNVVVIGLDPRDVGRLVDTDAHNTYPDELDETWTASEREDGEWRMYAAAPIRNEQDAVVGTVWMTINLAEAEAFIGRTRETLWLVGGGLALVGLALSWALTTPVVATTRQLTRHASRIAQGEYAPIPRRQGGTLSKALSWLVNRTSLRLRLTAAMLVVVSLLVGTLEAAVVPIERHHVERTVKDTMLGAAEWMAGLFSESFDLEGTDLTLDQLSDLDEMLGMMENMDLAKLQELSEDLQINDVAYVALVDQDGVIQISDQLSLVGESVPIPSAARIEEDRWRDKDIWVLSTPLRQGRGGEQIGALRFGLRRDRIEAFLIETRNLFRLTGVIAALASVLLAQAVGGAVTAPVRQLASGVRRVGAGDLDVQFQVRTRDELAALARALNEMTAGLREREWLRDMFGRFVSHEVAEAIRTGQVRLAGENRVVSVLFCDIRDFTQRSSVHTPEQIVALLNEYLPVVVQAAQHHAGTVNKFGGDSTLIIYGAPRKLQESAYRAVLTALEIRASLQALNARLTLQGQEPIRIGVGINTGVALAGAVGPEARQEYTVIGDTVNLASRIETLNKEYPQHDILISGWTYDALGTRRREFQFVDLGDIPIRGKAEPVRVWAVVGGADERGPNRERR